MNISREIITEKYPDSDGFPQNRAENIFVLLESLNTLSKGDRSEKGKLIRRNLRKNGFYLSQFGK